MTTDRCRPHGIPFDRSLCPPDDEHTDALAEILGRIDSARAARPGAATFPPAASPTPAAGGSSVRGGVLPSPFRTPRAARRAPHAARGGARRRSALAATGPSDGTAARVLIHPSARAAVRSPHNTTPEAPR